MKPREISMLTTAPFHETLEDNLEYVSDEIHRFYADKVATGVVKTSGMK